MRSIGINEAIDDREVSANVNASPPDVFAMKLVVVQNRVELILEKESASFVEPFFLPRTQLLESFIETPMRDDIHSASR